ncbi:MAG: hypothetical protein KBC12_00380 [Candidatus Pacebacteria bacterium]|nr:hypothetical protein [Candidatus Paceibacterota bacterium]MBP9851109.1 hypothetical protein [Candidatus Paceibacterota bacterium]
MLKSHFFLKTILAIVFLALVFFLPFSTTRAQVQETDVSIGVNPTYPKPGESVVVTLNSFTVKLDKAFIIWSVNGVERANGVGKKSFSFNLDPFSSKTQVSASVSNVAGDTITKNIFINSVDVDVLWEAVDSYVPPFYRGKALGVREGNFKIVVIPNIISSRGKLSPGNLSYNWKKDGAVQVSVSGFGKDSFVYKNSYLDESNEIQVEISDVESKTKTGSKITIPTLSKPEIFFYRRDPKLGLALEKTIVDGYSLGETPETIVAVPYFFSPKNLNSQILSFNWSSGGEGIKPNRNRNEVTVVAPKGSSGGTELKVVIENKGSLFQTLEKKLNVTF